jgi:hypothetical protein
MRSYQNCKHVWLEGIKPVFIRDTGVLWISKLIISAWPEKSKAGTA